MGIKKSPTARVGLRVKSIFLGELVGESGAIVAGLDVGEAVYFHSFRLFVLRRYFHLLYLRIIEFAVVGGDDRFSGDEVKPGAAVDELSILFVSEVFSPIS